MSGYDNLHKLLDEYLNFEVAGKKVKIPYVMERSRMAFNKTSGKGAPRMLKDEVLRVAESEGFDIEKASEFEVYDFMRNQRIGIDCSGLVYHLLNEYLQGEKDVDLSEVLVRKEGVFGLLEKNILSFQRHRRVNAATLTSELNTVRVERATDIKVGDLIRMSIKKPADHVLLVVDVDKDKDANANSFSYVHSSSVNTKKRGPHLGKINVVDKEGGIEKQDWQERTKTGESYKIHFHPERGDGLRRLKLLADEQDVKIDSDHV
ncbi:hypothetical protein KC614_02870 [candidate division WWE3 bacterium]|uniref:Uncharacterized protein n=1 Tax=candidate division WWE3 bacterium TaxID=2053526 RepID=A0A955LLL1_UNCKA|nr:hypothetical protein [candidate division WWE3 bacterium]